jgi:hypothetical protein
MRNKPLSVEQGLQQPGKQLIKQYKNGAIYIDIEISVTNIYM